MGPDKRTDLRWRITRQILLTAAVVGAVLLTACGSGDGPDGDAAAQPTTAPASQQTASPVSDSQPTPNPTTVNELVFAPDFQLPQAGGGTVTLSEVYGRANTVVVFYRGYF